MPVTSALGRLRKENHKFRPAWDTYPDPASKRKEIQGSIIAMPVTCCKALDKLLIPKNGTKNNTYLKGILGG
jgi:hypothetical protein